MSELKSEPFVRIPVHEHARQGSSSFGNVEHGLETTFLPKEWLDDLATAFYHSVAARMDRMLGPSELRRRGHVEVTPYTPEEITARAQAVAQWELITADLVVKGYLERDHCYECGGELVPVTATETRVWVHDETTAEWAERVRRIREGNTNG